MAKVKIGERMITEQEEKKRQFEISTTLCWATHSSEVLHWSCRVSTG
jgi:hypothetical protein